MVFVIIVDAGIEWAGINDRDHFPTRQRVSPRNRAPYDDDRYDPATQRVGGESVQTAPGTHSRLFERSRIRTLPAFGLRVPELGRDHRVGLLLCASYAHHSIRPSRCPPSRPQCGRPNVITVPLVSDLLLSPRTAASSHGNARLAEPGHPPDVWRMRGICSNECVAFSGEAFRGASPGFLASQRARCEHN